MTDSSSTVIQARPRYIQDIDEPLLGRIFGTPDEFGVLSGGLIDDPDLFQIPNYVQAQSALQDAVAGTFATPEQRQAFMDRYQTYFTDDQGVARYLPDAAAGLQQGLGTIGTAISDYFPDAKTYLQEGRGDIGAKDIFDTELSEARSKADQGTGTFDAKSRANALLGDARSEIQAGLGQASKVDVEEGGEFGARDAFKRGTRRALQLAEEGLGRCDPVARTQEFMDPYEEQVVDAALRKIDREGAKRRQAGAAKAIGAGAFGGSRAGVQAAETERAIEETRQDTIANLMSQGYDKALASAMATDEAARKRSLQASGLTGELGARGAGLESKAFEDAAKRGLAATSTEAQLNQKAFEDAMRRQLSGGTALGDIGRAQLGAESGAFEAGKNRMLKAADMYRSMGLSSAEAQARAAQDERKRSLEAGRLMGGLGSTLGQLGGAQGNIGRAFGALAGQSANIGQAYAGMAPADLGFMYELGGKERQYGQQYEDMLRKNQLLTTQEALAPYSYAQNFLTGSPSASIYGEFTSQPSSAPNPFLSGVGAYTAGQGYMQQ